MNSKQKKLACGIFDTFATHVVLLHDVTDADCREQNVGTHGHVFAGFRRRYLTNMTRNRVKKPMQWVYVSFFSYR